MAHASRLKPLRLGEKLRQIRIAFGLSQNELIQRIGFTDELIREEISAFERGIRLPPYALTLEVARISNVYVDALIDDELDLPAELPSRVKHEGMKRVSSSRDKRKTIASKIRESKKT